MMVVSLAFRNVFPLQQLQVLSTTKTGYIILPLMSITLVPTGLGREHPMIDSSETKTAICFEKCDSGGGGPALSLCVFIGESNRGNHHVEESVAIRC
jgi:hypothetical protein